MRPDMERLGCGRGVEEGWFWVPGGHVYQKQGRPDRECALWGLRSEGGRRGTPSRLGQTWLLVSKGSGREVGISADLLAPA